MDNHLLLIGDGMLFRVTRGLIDDIERRQTTLRRKIDDFLDRWSVPVLWITLGAFAYGWRRVRWSVRQQAWLVIVASDVPTRRQLGVKLHRRLRAMGGSL